MSSGWYRVLAGAQLVAQAAAKQASYDVSKSSMRIADHVVDLGAKAGTTALSSEQAQALQRTLENLVIQFYANASSKDTFNASHAYDDQHQSSMHEKTEEPIDLKGYDWVNEELERLQKQSEKQDLPSYYNVNFSGAKAETEQTLHAAESETNGISSPPSHGTTKLRTDNLGTTENNIHNEDAKQPQSYQDPVDMATPSVSTARENFVASENQILSNNETSFTNEFLEDLSVSPTRLKEGTPVPSTRIGRAMGFVSLGAGLAYGTAMEGLSRLVGTSSSSASIIINDSNSDRLAASLCRMRGAALKMGQMLSIQDESLLPAPLARALQQVRQGANAMPNYQLVKQLESQLGKDWRDLFVEFDELPFAAASIGQVHRATIKDGDSLKHVVVKVQYPGVASSIKSDLRNLGMLVKWTGLAPKGLFIENVIRVGEKELQVECDYRREMLNQRRIKTLIENDPVLQANKFVVPDVVMHLTSEQVLTSEYRPGRTIDSVAHLSQDERNRIGRHILFLTMKELFVWRFMQTDPNWGNFLYDASTQTTSLIDFGATREFSKEFVDGYLRIVWASANQDETTLMKQSYAMSFLTGDENAQMIQAHKQSGYTVGEPFYKDMPFDFRGSSISTRLGEHTAVFLSHRLTPPPEEVYTLHRKLAGAYMLCIKLGAVIHCRDMLEEIVRSHTFDDGPPPEL
jgi:aarF domain-containing kinase